MLPQPTYAEAPARRQNANILADALEGEAARLKPRKRGIEWSTLPSSNTVPGSSAVPSQHGVSQWQDHGRLLPTMVGVEEPAVHSSPLPKRRCIGKTHPNTMHQVLVSYSPTRAGRRRLYARVKPAAQSMDLRATAVVLGHTFDVDIKHCMVSLQPQMLDRLDSADISQFPEEGNLLRHMARDPSAFIQDVLAMPQETGKKMVLAEASVVAHFWQESRTMS